MAEKAYLKAIEFNPDLKSSITNVEENKGL